MKEPDLQRNDDMNPVSNREPCPAGEPQQAATDDLQSLGRILGNLQGHLETLIDQRPLDALALSLVVQAAENIRTASRTAERVRQENAESARRRAALERFRTADALQRRLAEAPALALAEAKASQEGCGGVIALWRSLGEALAGGEGWNDEELTLARALTGSADPSLKTTRPRVRLERALDRDRQKPLADLVATTDRVMHSYVDRLAVILNDLGIDDRNLHEIVIETVVDKSFELSSMIGVDDREAIARYRERTQARFSGRTRWATVRAFVAGQIRIWKSIRNQRAKIEDIEDDGFATESLGLAEMRKADWARKNLSAAIADFQKTLALGKSLGLPEVICPKPPKPGKQALGTEKTTNGRSIDSETESNSLRPAPEPIVKAPRARANSADCTRANVRTIEIADKMTRVRTTDLRFRNQPAESRLPRDARGRFLPGAVVSQPRDSRGRFRKANSKVEVRRAVPNPVRPEVCRTMTRPLRPTSKGQSHLRMVEPNVAGREQATAGAANVLADFAENVQNDETNRMPGSDQVSESRSDLPPDTERGVAGDGER